MRARVRVRVRARARARARVRVRARVVGREPHLWARRRGRCRGHAHGRSRCSPVPAHDWHSLPSAPLIAKGPPLDVSVVVADPVYVHPVLHSAVFYRARVPLIHCWPEHLDTVTCSELRQRLVSFVLPCRLREFLESTDPIEKNGHKGNPRECDDTRQCIVAHHHHQRELAARYVKAC